MDKLSISLLLVKVLAFIGNRFMRSYPKVHQLFIGGILSLGLGVAVHWIYIKSETQRLQRDFRHNAFQQMDKPLKQSATILKQLAEAIERCDDKAQITLRDTEFYDANTRLIGWVDELQQVCTSNPGLNDVLVHLPDVLHRYRYTEKVGLNLIEALNNRTQWVLTLNHQGKLWFAMLEPWAQPISCQKCATITVGEKAQQDVAFLLGTLPVSIRYHLTAFRARLEKSAMVWGMCTTVFFGGLFITLLLWRQGWSQSPAQSLKLAIEQEEIEPYFQLIVDSRTGRATHCEILARWTQGESTMLPNEFIPLAESTGLIDALLISLMRQTLNLIRENDSIGASLTYSFNVSPSQLERPVFVEQLMALCQSASSVHLAFEITEREPFKSPEKAKLTLKAFADLGVLLELDDAGTGYGSFSYLQEFGFHVLKIDKMFVDTIMQNSLKRPILEGIIEFGHTAQLIMIAEGVEHEEQAQYLHERGVYLHQGYYYYSPLNRRVFLEHAAHMKNSEA
ncbi:EAL domain-containing protein [Vibrio coralliilyticus]|uniref:EAL domain-containing protein n=1 Tax=Vibrio coralliilyticus TaxID=190893 RepID=UPI001E47CECD|nr:EAL domain-containing protein [Vibrio coralliilyticus]MCC2525583.1 EAL domain-containing protein [Vibrio coralliilyticus]